VEGAAGLVGEHPHLRVVVGVAGVEVLVLSGEENDQRVKRSFRDAEVDQIEVLRRHLEDRGKCEMTLMALTHCPKNITSSAFRRNKSTWTL
jgi:hypothetical protein